MTGNNISLDLLLYLLSDKIESGRLLNRPDAELHHSRQGHSFALPIARIYKFHWTLYSTVTSV